ncbi:MAG: hypothetical protein AAFR64_01310 [Pseudomonadota bacterium]
MVDTTPQSERIIGEAGRSLRVQRAGGTHRSAVSIGKGSAQQKAQVWIDRAKYFLGALAVIFATMTVSGLVLGGIGFTGVMMVALAVMAAAFVFGNYPKLKVPKREELKLGTPQEMVANTELWLERQTPALPAPAVSVVEKLGVQLDALGLQLETIDAEHPAVSEVRELVGEYIPETIDNYRKIPEHLRTEKHTGKSADERLTDSLGKLSGEIDRVTRRLAEGAMDDLAIKDRYLEYRYGGSEALEKPS